MFDSVSIILMVATALTAFVIFLWGARPPARVLLMLCLIGMVFMIFERVVAPRFGVTAAAAFEHERPIALLLVSNTVAIVVAIAATLLSIGSICADASASDEAPGA